tara:strand:+ start:979 stop:1740 length:762 start_codon:yes stop_codon:yes gene_type:complete
MLGRDKDPRLANDIGYINLFFRKLIWSVVTIPGLRILTKIIFPKSTISSFKTNKRIVAFTIDDGFCGLDNPDGCLLDKVRKLFKKYNATATFFVTGTHCKHTKSKHVTDLLEDGHEIANHNMMDWPYTNYSEIEFKNDLEKTENVFSQFHIKPSRWYRAPFGRINKNMQKVLDKKKLQHIVCDCFANDTTIPDAKWISNFILKRVRPGSIVLIHMPEKNVREWNYNALKLTLSGLQKKGIKIVNLSEMKILCA